MVCVSADMKNLVVGNVENMGREMERDNQAQNYLTTQRVAALHQPEEDVFEALEAAEEVYATGSGPPSLGHEESVIKYVSCMSALPAIPACHHR